MTAPDPVYLDFNATTPLDPQAREAMLPFLSGEFGNPSSSHPLGKRARAAVEEARAEVALLLGATPDEVVFTGGGTEANNLAIQGVAAAHRGGRREILHSSVEHPAVSEPCRHLASRGFTVTELPVDGHGVVREAAWQERLTGQTLMISVMHANNEVGSIQPLAAISRRARAVGALLHSDAAQTPGRVPLHVHELGLDLCTLVPHKFHGPKGVGVLFIRAGLTVAPQVLGAGHERGLRSGTENVAALVATGVAARLARQRQAEDAAWMEALRERLWNSLSARVPGLWRNSPPGGLCNTLHVSFGGRSGAEVLSRAPTVMASVGSACHGTGLSAVLTAMGVGGEQAAGAVRLSLGRTTSQDDVDRAAAALADAARGG